ncbi:MAG: YslB family protein, partial [Liquorilactobacillus hordei]
MDVKKYLELSQKKELVNTLGYEVIRDILVPELIGDNHNILYWAGKRLAREVYLAKDDDLPVFFSEAGWGDLKRIKGNKKQQLFELSGDVVQLRNQVVKQADFLLEAGFLAETIQLQSGFVCEAII